MARLSTCKKCQKQLQPTEKFVFSNKTYCETCYNIIKSESDEYKELVKLICNIFQIDVPTGLIFKQIKEYKNELQYNYAAISYTLWYCKEILNKSFDIKYGIALVKYNYDDAKNYFLQQDKIMKSITSVKTKPRIIKVNNQQNDKTTTLIDIEKIAKGGDYNKL